MKNEYTIYWLISENKKNTYIGFTSELERRLAEHNNKKVETTKDFNNFKAYTLEKVDTLQKARIREKY